MSHSNESDELKIEFVPSKKQKLSLNESDTTIKSIFLNSSDHNEFVSYLQLIEQSQIAKTSNTPFVINREIAEYATGVIEQCSNSKCCAGICVLNEHWVDFNNGDPKKWNYCLRKNKYFCEICTPFTANFICCDTIQCFKNYKKCEGHLCTDPIMCYDDWLEECLMAYKCFYCADYDDGLCEKCGDWMCSFHRELTKCAEGAHNSCCGGEFICSKCCDDYCFQCSHIGPVGLICDECIDFTCDDCVYRKARENGVFCEICYAWFCNQCMDEHHPGGNCKFCGQFRCGEFGCILNDGYCDCRK